MLLAVLACATEPDATRYTRAVAAADYDAAIEACAGIRDEGTRGDCAVTSMKRFGRWDGCGDVASEGWRNECWFLRAERLARDAAWTDALDACRASEFVDNCDSHVLQMAAVTTHAGPHADAGALIETLRPHIVTPHADMDFWRARVRQRLSRGLPAAPEDCPNASCRNATRHEIEAAYTEAVRAHGCEAWPSWIADSEDATRWVRKVQARLCPVPG